MGGRPWVVGSLNCGGLRTLLQAHYCWQARLSALMKPVEASLSHRPFMPAYCPSGPAATGPATTGPAATGPAATSPAAVATPLPATNVTTPTTLPAAVAPGANVTVPSPEPAPLPVAVLPENMTEGNMTEGNMTMNETLGGEVAGEMPSGESCACGCWELGRVGSLPPFTRSSLLHHCPTHPTHAHPTCCRGAPPRCRQRHGECDHRQRHGRGPDQA